MRSAAILFAATLTTSLAVVRADPPKPEKFDDTGFVTIFDGKTLDGWKVSAKTGHSRTTKNKSGGGPTWRRPTGRPRRSRSAAVGWHGGRLGVIRAVKLRKKHR